MLRQDPEISLYKKQVNGRCNTCNTYQPQTAAHAARFQRVPQSRVTGGMQDGRFVYEREVNHIQETQHPKHIGGILDRTPAVPVAFGKQRGQRGMDLAYMHKAVCFHS